MRGQITAAAALLLGLTSLFHQAPAPDALQAVRLDTANPYRWAEYAENIDRAGRSDDARRAYQRAVVLAPSVPQIWLRYTNFLLLHDQPEEALNTAARVLRSVPDYDTVLFGYFDELLPPERLLAAIGDQPRALRSWLQYSIDNNHPEAAKLAWTRLSADADDKLAATYVNYLVRVQPAAAPLVWARHLGGRARDFPVRNLLYNGDFAQVFTPCLLDWHVTPSEEVETSRNRIRFTGKTNVAYDHLYQQVVLPRAGPYRLIARAKSLNLTTNEGIRVAIPELNLASTALSGTSEWTDLIIDFSVPGPRAVRVAVVRRPSAKFDNKIAGQVEFASFRLIFLST